ncbi:hypothetical protein DFJ73DRAFT_186947 [Zopfochytrium polystomum]|nr:hypothetical protein DFJ73DRAFT_186947 [Zopfochytrium polystomum]
MRTMYRLSGQLRRQLGKKVLELSGNAVISYKQSFDFEEEEKSITARAIGTAVRISLPDPSLMVERGMSWLSVTPSPVVMPSDTGTFGSSSHGLNLDGLQALPTRNSESADSSSPRPNGASASASNVDLSYGLAPLALPNSAMHPGFFPPHHPLHHAHHHHHGHHHNNGHPMGQLHLLFDQQPITISSFPPSAVLGIGGFVCATSIKLVSEASDFLTGGGSGGSGTGGGGIGGAAGMAGAVGMSAASAAASAAAAAASAAGHGVPGSGIAGSGAAPSNATEAVRESWWVELREEVRSHARTLGCSVIVGYVERASFHGDMAVLYCYGTAAIVDMGVLAGGSGSGGVSGSGFGLDGSFISRSELRRQRRLRSAGPTMLVEQVASGSFSSFAGEAASAAGASAPVMVSRKRSSDAAEQLSGSTERPSAGPGLNVVAASEKRLIEADDKERSSPVDIVAPSSFPSNNSHGQRPSVSGAGSFKDWAMFDQLARRRRRLGKNPGCQACHITYPRASAAFPMAFVKCGLCHKKYVPEILLTTMEPPPELRTIGKGVLIEAHVCRLKKNRTGESEASTVSEAMPFAQYDIHRQLMFKLRINGLNAVFGLKLQFSVGETLMTAVATGTALFVRALPPPPALKVFRNLEVVDEEDQRLLEIQRAIVEKSEANRRAVEAALVAEISAEKRNGQDTLAGRSGTGTPTVLPSGSLGRRRTGKRKARAHFAEDDGRFGEASGNGARAVLGNPAAMVASPLSRDLAVSEVEPVNVASEREDADSATDESDSDSDSDQEGGSGAASATGGTGTGANPPAGGHAMSPAAGGGSRHRNLVVQIDDEHDEDLVLVMDPTFPDDFRMQNIQTLPPQNLGDSSSDPVGSDLIQSSQMITMVRQGFIQLTSHHPNRQLGALFKSLYQELQFNLWYLSPCVVVGLDYDLQIVKTNEVQIRMTALAVGQMKGLKSRVGKKHRKLRGKRRGDSLGRKESLTTKIAGEGDAGDSGAEADNNTSGSEDNDSDSDSIDSDEFSALDGAAGAGAGGGAKLSVNSKAVAGVNVEPPELPSERQLTLTSLGTDVSPPSTTDDEDDLVFSMEDDDAGVVASVSSVPTGSSPLPPSAHFALDGQESVSRGSTGGGPRPSGLSTSTVPPLDPLAIAVPTLGQLQSKLATAASSPVEITTLADLPSAAGQPVRFLGHVSLHFVKEASITYEAGLAGMGGFAHTFLVELNSVVRAHAGALGGHGMVNFVVEQSAFSESIKNQGYSLISVSGDVVQIAHREGAAVKRHEGPLVTRLLGAGGGGGGNGGVSL